MSIIVENQKVKAGVRLQSGDLEIHFSEEPALALGETVLIDLMQRSIGIIYQNAYHHIGDLPLNMGEKEVAAMTDASLTGQGAGGRMIHLHAPVKIVRN